GLFNGTLDGTDINTDYSSDKDLVGRIIIQPFINSENRLINGFGFGIAGSSGVRDGTLGAPRLPVYSSGGRRNIFRYRSNETPGETSIAVGKQSRIAPQLYHYIGPLGVMFEYVASTHNVMIGENSGKLVHTAWNIQGAYLLTGENKSYGAVRPSNPLGNGNGAFEIALRYGSLSFDEKTYPMFSDPARFSETINAWAVGLNWYPTTGTKLSIS